MRYTYGMSCVSLILMFTMSVFNKIEIDAICNRKDQFTL